MTFIFTGRIRQKLKQKHDVSPLEVEQCFWNRTGKFLEDSREENRTHPATQWFIADTDTGRRLKIVFIEEAVNEIHIKTAYEPNANEERIYGRYC